MLPTTIEIEQDAAAALDASSAPTAPRARHTLSSPIADQPILSIRATVSHARAERFIADALRDIRAFMQEHHVTPAGPPFSICRPDGQSLDIEAGWPTPRAVPGTRRIHSGAVPSSFSRSVMDGDDFGT